MTIETNEVRGQSLDCAREFVRADGCWQVGHHRAPAKACKCATVA